MEKIDSIKEILAKYAEVEEQLDRKLEKLKQEELKLNLTDDSSEGDSPQHQRPLSLEEAKLRNANLLKSLEISKARLRSRSTFSPVEQILQQAIENYQKKPALVPLAEPASRRTAQTAESYHHFTDVSLSRSSAAFD